ncbi:hypothetical protein [Chryseobacterium oryctis]|uniref:Uncharacterized protein n=1 Tax=Chryseobacterium oryctis TaxID=2952618 RepID=A0ABT3HJN0_9FLAO|nr:hypothetical protein [Chryseobacterium oryctis]MCW3160005.1 hypothetical protein [Chryseobacterium oryctis]
MELKEYFQSYRDYFWEWNTDEDVSEDTGYSVNNTIYFSTLKTTVAYRSYIIDVLKELKIQGWPPFGSLLLVLYATQDGYLDMNSLFSEIKKNSERQELDDMIVEAREFLEKLQSLSHVYKKGQNRIILFHTIFNENRACISSDKAELLYRRYLRMPHLIGESANKKAFSLEVLQKDIRTLALANRKFPTMQSIVDAIRGFTKEPELDDEVIEDETTVETDKDFIQELIEESKTFQVGSLIKRIWSGLKIPMRHLSPGEQSIGGISDMTNKGDLHRMLLSEFANEDEVFMSRIANNEALYIQREIPPEENIFERIILIDTSLKNWGTPKVLAFASTIAIVKHPKAHSGCKVFTLGQSSMPISLDKVEQVVENLNQVSGNLDVSEALENFFQKEQKEKNLEVFFITNEENLSNQNLQKVIQENRDRLKFVVTTSVNGELNFYKHHNGQRKHIQKIVLPLKELWSNPPKKKFANKTETSQKGAKMPVPLNYPLLFPTPKQRIATFLYEGDFYILSNKKQLLKTYLSDNYYNKSIYQNTRIHRGCEVVVENISVKPRGQFSLARNKAGNYILCQYQTDKKILSKLNLTTKEYSELNVTGQNIPLNFELIYFDRSFYLYQDQFPTIFKINIEGNISIEQIKNDDKIAKSYIRNQVEIGRLENGGVNILSNFGKIGINEFEELVVSKLALAQQHEKVFSFEKNKYDIEVLASQSKNKYTFEDGSEIITDSRGMLTCISSNKKIPVFYIPAAQNGYLALSTEKDFGGSEYYLPQKALLKIREMDDMYSDYLESFIKHILEYGTEN